MLTPGQKIGRFEVRAPVGKGGMGAVYVAFDASLGRQVALKVMHEDLTKDAVSVERFRREALALAKLAHAGVVRIFDLVEAEGRLILVMEHLAGESLRQRLAAGPIPVDEAVGLAGQILAALEAAHELGVLHRDLKPANVFVTARGEAKLLDFGVARLADATRLTETGELLGTVRYMAPEILHGVEPSARSDVHAVGAILFEMLAGRPAYDGTGVDLVVQIRAGSPPRLLDVAPGVPADVAAVVDRALSADPAARFESAAAFLRALPAPSAAPLAAPSAAAAARPRRSARRGLAWLALALVVVGAVGAAVAAAFVTAPGRRRAPEVRALALADPPSPSSVEPAPPIASGAPSVASSAPRARAPRIDLYKRHVGYSLGESGDREAAEALERLVRSRAPAIRRCIELAPERLDRVAVMLDEHTGTHCEYRDGTGDHPFPCCTTALADLRLPGDMQRFDMTLEVERVP